MKRRLRVGICGLGTVGGAVGRLLGDDQRRAEYERRCGCELHLSKVAARNARSADQLRDIGLPAGVVCETDPMALARADDIDVLLELIGGVETAAPLAREALASGKHLITANKALLAEVGGELFELARANDRQLLWEAAVAGGIPIVRAMRDSLAATRPRRILGILNGTSNFILSAMSDEMDYDEALDEARKLGYAEADPEADIEGLDAAAKLLLLAHLAWGTPPDKRNFEAVRRRGIADLRRIDFHQAAEWGFAIKPLAVAECASDEASLSVHPALVPRGELLASVAGADNAVEVETDLGTMIFCGPGAGAEATASAVLADLLALAAGAAGDATPPEQAPTVSTRIDARSSRVYLRFEVRDEPGTLAAISEALAERDIDIKQIAQDRPKSIADGDDLPLRMLIKATPSKLREALKQIDDLPSASGALHLPVMEARPD